jgi:hypothetical protein
MGNKNRAVKADKVNVIKFMQGVMGQQKKGKHLLHTITRSIFVYFW